MRRFRLVLAALVVQVSASLAHAALTVTGDVLPTDPPSTWSGNDGDNATYAYVGYSAYGAVNVDNGSSLATFETWIGYQNGSTGIVTVDGIGSSWTNLCGPMIGYYGNGTLKIVEGGTVNGGGSTTIGAMSGSIGEAVIDGVGSNWINSGLIVGIDGAGTLKITNGGTVNSTYASGTGMPSDRIGASGKVQIDGHGSAWSVNDGLSVSCGGTMAITNGGTVSSRSGYLGQSLASSTTAAVTVDGEGSAWNVTGDCYVGYYNGSAAVLNITNGGTASVSGVTAVAKNAGSTGAIRFGANGGTLKTQSLLAGSSQMSGIGTINTHGLVSDVQLAFDAKHALSQSVVVANLQGQNIRINVDVSGTGSDVGMLGAGCVGNGSLVIQDGVKVRSSWGYVGYQAGSNGTVTISGAGSQWNVNDEGLTTNNRGLFVGVRGCGTMEIADGGNVTTTTGVIASEAGSSGVVTVTGVGSSWTVSRSSYFDVGKHGTGTLNIINGGTVTSNTSNLGSNSGATGTVNVDGAGSTWVNSGSIYVGYYGGRGTLNITNGGNVQSDLSSIGNCNYSNCVGSATVDGAGSTWKVGHFFGVANGTLNITKGGVVAITPSAPTPMACDFNNLGRVNIDVGCGSLLDIGTGSLGNYGVIYLSAGANAAAGVYTPIIAGSWSGFGSYETVGGFWDIDNHVFKISDIKQGSSGETISIALTSTQRVLISDAKTGWSVGASFQASTGTTPLEVTATAISDDVLSLLQTTVSAKSILGGWVFSTAGYTEGDPVYLSVKIGSEYSLDSLNIWHFDGDNWSKYLATDMSYDGTYVNFTVTGFSGYAVSGAKIPEPGSLTLLTLGLAGVLAYAWRKCKA